MDVAIPKLRAGLLLPGLAAGAPPAGRGGADHGGGDLLPARGVAPGGWTSWSQTLGITGLSKSQVSVMAKDLDEQVEAFRTRPLDAGPVHVRGRGRVDDEGPRGRPGGQRRTSWSPPASTPTGTARSSASQVATSRGRRRLAGVLPRPGRPRPDRGHAGHLRRPRRPGRRRSARPCPARPGSAAAPTTPRT